MANDSTGQVVAMANARPEHGRLIQPRSLNQWTNTSFGALKLSTLHRILRNAERGEVEDWADLVEYMLTSDPHIRSVYETRLMAVAGASWQVVPGRGPEGSEGLAADAAQRLQEELERHSDVQRLFGDLLHAVALGWAALEHRWFAEGGKWRTDPSWIHPRDIRIEPDWTVAVRTYEGRSGGRERWIRVADHPDKFLVHMPRPISASPTKSGELMAVAWQWLFKRWNEKYRNAAMERFGTPHIFGMTPPDATKTARDELFDGLESLSFDHIGAFESGTEVEIIEPQRDPGESCNLVIQAINAEISKSYLGSGLNVEVSGPGGSGNRALGESQFDTTILPRLQSDARRLANTIERDWFRPWCDFNRHLFGGAMPPIPRLELQVVSDDPAPVSELSVLVGAATLDEVRRGEGREPWGEERGGNRVAVPIAKTPPTAPGTAAASGGAAPRPFSRSLTAWRPMKQLSLPLNGNTRTSSRSRTRALAVALAGGSVTRTSS